MMWLGILILIAAPPLYVLGLQMVCAPRSTSAVLVRGLDSLGCFARDVVDYTTAFFAIGVRSGVSGTSEKESKYERDCRKYADTLPAFSEETRRIMQREGVLPRQSPQVHWGEAHDKPEWPERVDPVRGVKISEAAKRKIRRDFPLASDYAPRIVREVVEVEEIEITSKSSSKVIVEGFERRYYEPIEEPDISRILLDD